MKTESRRYNALNETGSEFYARIKKVRNNQAYFDLMKKKYWPEYKAAQKQNKPK